MILHILDIFTISRFFKHITKKNYDDLYHLSLKDIFLKKVHTI